MRITIIQVGKTKSSYFIEAENEYLKRLSAYAEVNIETLKEQTLPGNKGVTMKDEVKKKEGIEILAKVPRDCFLVCLDEKGKEMDSFMFADFLRKQRDFEGANLCFVIGGCYGLAEEVISRANLRLAFSKMTFTHEMIRSILLEQIYRGFTIVQGKTYHY